MADFYDHPDTGKLFIRGPAGGGTSFFDGPATETDIRNHPDAHARYVAAKHLAHARAREAEAERHAALKAEEERLAAELAQAHAAAAADTPPSS